MSKYKDKETQRAEKYMKVSELSDDMAKWITRNEEEWMKIILLSPFYPLSGICFHLNVEHSVDARRRHSLYYG